MKLRIIQKPSLTGNPDVFWYHAQVKRFGFWIDCRNDIILVLRYTTEMLYHDHSTDLKSVENFVDHLIRNEEMFPQIKNKVIREYTA